MFYAKPSRAMLFLLRQGTSTDPEIRVQSLETLAADDFLAISATPFTLMGWGCAFFVTRAPWILLFALSDLLLCGVRIWLRFRGTTQPQDPAHQTDAVWTSLAWTLLVAILVLVLFRTPSERVLLLGFMVWIGTSGYLGAMLASFPTLALICVGLVNAAAAIGMATGWSDAARPFALSSLGVAVAYCFLMRRMHRVLIGAMRAQQASRRLALHDPLTKLPNRTLLRERLKRLMARTETPVAVLCLDLDGFKTINDRHGHAAGDWVLVHVAEILGTVIAPNDVAARIGGDEFVVLLTDADGDRVRAVSDSIIARVREPLDIGRVIPASVGVSIGAILVDRAVGTIDAVLERADVALYLAKRSGKGRLCFVDSAVQNPSATGPG